MDVKPILHVFDVYTEMFTLSILQIAEATCNRVLHTPDVGYAHPGNYFVLNAGLRPSPLAKCQVPLKLRPHPCTSCPGTLLLKEGITPYDKAWIVI